MKDKKKRSSDAAFPIMLFLGPLGVGVILGFGFAASQFFNYGNCP